MKHHIKLITFASIVSVSLVGCGEILYKLRTEKKCDPNNIEKGIYAGCEITAEVENKLPEISSSVLIRTSYQETERASICTGNFIAENIILTAGHCLIKKNEENEILKVVQIAIDNKKTVHTHYMAKQIDDPVYIVHPHYSANAKYVKETKNKNNSKPFDISDFADLALIYSTYSATELNAKIISLSESTKANERVYFVGYGQLTDTDDDSKIKEKKWGTAYTTQIYNLDINKKRFRDKNNKFWDIIDYWNKHLSKYISGQYKTKSPAESFLFTNGYKNEEGICSGDSGGVIFIKRNNEFLGAGVVHASSGECSEKVSLNMRIGAYKDWISSESKELERIHRTEQRIQFVP
ncbi:trypsin-like serine protease [Fluviispira vulneris]|uniref:trypsin-like serine protease n=1 Tax=Fluviispira vulneris TaxID=2763012 RepID=UPI0016473B73|nr:trypsin-like serine protease [Fluviispira vulneris]